MSQFCPFEVSGSVSGLVNSESRRFVNSAFPPIAATSPSGSCSTCHVYWNALPSVKSLSRSLPWPKA